jgi:hypothetical protein
MANFAFSRRQFFGGRAPSSSEPANESPVASDDLGLPREKLSDCAYQALGHCDVALRGSKDPHVVSKHLLTRLGLRWGQIVDVVDLTLPETPRVIASVISVEVRPGAHLPLVVPNDAADGKGDVFHARVTQHARSLYGLTVEDRFAQIEYERDMQAAQDQETRTMHRRVWAAGGFVGLATMALIGAGPAVERWLKPDEEDPVAALDRHILERGPREVAVVIAVDRSIKKDPTRARAFLSRVSPRHYDAFVSYAASGEVSEPNAVLLVQVLHRLALLELSLGKPSDEQADARTAFESRYNLIIRDTPYQGVRLEAVDLLKRF